MAPRSTEPTARGSTPPTAGGCCAPRTRRTCWSRVPNRRARQGSSGWSGRSTTSSPDQASRAARKRATDPLFGGGGRRLVDLLGIVAESRAAAYRPGNVGDEIERPPLRFDIEPPEIFADHAEHEHLD